MTGVFPGVEIHANAIDNILRGDFIVHPNWAAIIDILSILAIGLILGLGLPRLSAWSGILLGAGLVAAWLLNNYYLFTKGYLVNILYPLLTLAAVYTGVTLFRYMTEEREKKKIKGAFSYYVNPSVVSEMLKNPDKLKLGRGKADHDRALLRHPGVYNHFRAVGPRGPGPVASTAT